VVRVSGPAAESHAGASGARTPPGPDSVARGTVFLSASRAAIVVVHGVIHIAVGRLVSPAAYGAFAAAFLVLAWVNAVTPSLVLPGLLKVVSEDPRRYRAALAFAVRWYLPAIAGATIVYGLSAPLLTRALGDPSLLPLLLLIGLQLPLTGVLRLGESLLIGLRRHMMTSCIRLAYACTAALVAGAFLSLGWGTTGAMAAIAAGSAAAAATALVLLLKPRVAPREQVSYPPMGRRALHWTAASLPAVACARTLMTLDLWMVKALALPNEAGLYAVAYMLSRFPMFAVLGLGSAVFPKVSEAAARGDLISARAASVDAMRALLIVFVPISCLTAACAPEILAFLFSPAYAGAAPALGVLAAVTPLAAWLLLCSRLIGAADRPGISLIVIAGLLVLSAGLNWLLISGWGMMGAACASLAVFGVGAAVSTMIVHHLLGANPPLATAARCLAAGAATCALAARWPVSGPMILLKLAVLVLLFGALLVALGEIRRRELRRLVAGVLGPGVDA